MELKLDSVLDPAIIDLAVAGTTKDEALRTLTKRLLDNGYIDDAEQFTADIYRREADGPTGVGDGVSIPHGKSPAAKRLGIAIGRLAEPVQWESSVGSDGWQGSRLVFLFCVPADAAFAENHLNLLGQLAGKLSDRDRLARLYGCGSGEELIRTLLGEEK